MQYRWLTHNSLSRMFRRFERHAAWNFRPLFIERCAGSTSSSSMSGRVTLEPSRRQRPVFRLLLPRSPCAASPGVAKDTRQRILDAAGRARIPDPRTAEVPAEFTIGMLVITRTRGTPEATYGPLMGAITRGLLGRRSGRAARHARRRRRATARGGAEARRPGRHRRLPRDRPVAVVGRRRPSR